MSFKAFLFIALLVPTFSQAAFLDEGCGNTRPQVEKGVGSTVNFAVLNDDFAEVGDPWGTGFSDFDKAFVQGIDYEGRLSPRLDLRARYLYLYQVVNDGLYDLSVPKTSVQILSGVYNKITSWGFFDGLSLADDKKESGKLEAVSILNSFGIPALQTSISPASIGVTGPGVVLIKEGTDAAVNPSEVALLPSTFYAKWKTEAGGLPTKKRGPVFGFTTNLPPTLDLTKVHPPHPRF